MLKFIYRMSPILVFFAGLFVNVSTLVGGLLSQALLASSIVLALFGMLVVPLQRRRPFWEVEPLVRNCSS